MVLDSSAPAAANITRAIVVAPRIVPNGTGARPHPDGAVPGAAGIPNDARKEPIAMTAPGDDRNLIDEYRNIAAIVAALALLQAATGAISVVGPLTLIAQGASTWTIGAIASSYALGFVVGARRRRRLSRRSRPLYKPSPGLVDADAGPDRPVCGRTSGLR